MNCPSCAAVLAPQATFCGTCGRAVEDPLIGALLSRRYRIEEKLAVGGFGAIYRGTQVTTNRRVAIKVMHRELSDDTKLVARFRREAAALCSLRDAHTVTTYELDQMLDGRLFIVMELLEGQNLLEVFRASGPLPWRRVLAIARSVCSALAEAHGLGIVHRDLKPANIFLEERRAGTDFVKVLDFGIAKIMQGSGIDDGTELTIMGQTVGTLEYMAPEQLIGGKCDGRTDQYTLGVVAYEMITGRRPFGAVLAADLLAMQLAERPPPPSAFVPLPPAVDRLLLRCVERDEGDRFPDIIALAEAIDAVLAQPDAALAIARSLTAPGIAAPRGLAPAPLPRRAASPPVAAWDASVRAHVTVPGGLAGVTAPMDAVEPAPTGGAAGGQPGDPPGRGPAEGGPDTVRELPAAHPSMVATEPLGLPRMAKPPAAGPAIGRAPTPQPPLPAIGRAPTPQPPLPAIGRAPTPQPLPTIGRAPTPLPAAMGLVAPAAASTVEPPPARRLVGPGLDFEDRTGLVRRQRTRRATALRFALWMLVLAAAGVGAGIAIAELAV